MPLLEIRNLSRRFGGLSAVSELDIHINRGEICGIIGPNGAGKSTILNMISGTIMPTKGKIYFDGEDITGFPTYRRAKRGIARVFQKNLLFHSMTVLENVLAGSYLCTKDRFLELFFKSTSAKTGEKALLKRAEEILEFVGLLKQSGEMATSLPHGNRRALCIAVALASDPKLLLLDEPLTGMDIDEVSRVIGIIKSLRDNKGITSVVVEHNIKAILGLCEHSIVMNFGTKMMEGTPKECVDNPEVIKAYLGGN